MTTKKILIGVVSLLIGLLAGLCIVIILQPSVLTVERSATMSAPPAAVFAQVDDLQAWDAWSPWIKLDPNPKTTMSTPSAGKGATFTWDGNDEIGAGSLTILESRPDERVKIEQAFIRPFAGKALMTFTLAPDESGTKLTWKMDAPHDFIGKAMCLFIDMDAMLGKDFEQALANIKDVVEKNDAGS